MVHPQSRRNHSVTAGRVLQAFAAGQEIPSWQLMCLSVGPNQQQPPEES
jgi:hypothetical protein